MRKLGRGITMISANIALVLAVIVFYIFAITIVPLLVIAQMDSSCMHTFKWALTPIEKFVNICGGSLFKD